MLADSFVFTSHLGEVVPRAEYLAHLREKSVLLRAADPTDELVYADGDVGIVQASYTVDESNRGVRFKGVLRTMRVWTWDGAAWKAIAYQATNVRAKAR